MDRPPTLLIRACALVLVLGGAAVAGDQPSQPAPAGKTPGMMIHRDPATGRLTAPPAGALAAPPAAAPTAPDAPVAERRGTTAAGGYLAEPGHRATKTMAATKDAAGRVQIDCLDGAPGGND